MKRLIAIVAVILFSTGMVALTSGSEAEASDSGTCVGTAHTPWYSYPWMMASSQLNCVDLHPDTFGDGELCSGLFARRPYATNWGEVDEDCKDIPNVDGTHWETAEGWCITWIDWVTVTRRTSTVMLHIFGIYDTQQSFSNQRTIWCEGSGGGWS